MGAITDKDVECSICGELAWEEQRTIAFELPGGFLAKYEVPDEVEGILRCANCKAVSMSPNFQDWYEQVYADVTGIVSGYDVLAIRSSLGIEQQTLDALMGWSKGTSERYERGNAEMEPSHGLALRALNEVPQFRNFLLNSFRDRVELQHSA